MGSKPAKRNVTYPLGPLPRWRLPEIVRPTIHCVQDKHLKYNLLLRYYRTAMSEQIVLVTRKGQVTIPITKRRKYGIKEGMRVLIRDSKEGIIIKPITPIEDLAGVDAGKISLEEMKKRLDGLRTQDRY
ncbi:AbrB/MazE/SpoVT family DNA-binding domain-containing protein [Candidatus Bathyarchaeota archaeon]|nr:AbrB/MazE/SpoVT family DNA-binding domain-containing protein [Candidatus Bathyarchaeota archaeon]